MNSSASRSLSQLLLAPALLAFAACALPACSAGEPAPAEDLGADESLLVTQVRLDRVKPKEVAKVYADTLLPIVASCVRAHPEITAIDASHVEGFHRIGSSGNWAVREAVVGILADRGGAAIPVGELADLVEPWAGSVMSRHVDADGYYAPGRGEGLAFHEAEQYARETKALRTAKSPGRKTLRSIRESWREVEDEQDNLDSAFLLPVKVSGSPSLGDIRKAMKLPKSARYVTWGNAAIDEFAQAGDGVDGLGSFDAVAGVLRGPGIVKRWYFAGGGDEWNHNYLIVLDEHDQVWGLMMGYTE